MCKTPEMIVTHASPMFTFTEIVQALRSREAEELAQKHLNQNRVYDWTDTSRIIQELNSRCSGLGAVDNVDLFALLRCVAPLYEVYGDAVYTRRYGPRGKSRPHKDKNLLLNHYMANSVELKHIVTNRVLQCLTGVFAARSHIHFTRHVKHLNNTFILLEGSECFSICLYANVTEDQIEQIKTRLKQSTPQKLKTTTAEEFLDWAFPVIPRKKLGWDADSWDLCLSGE